MWEVFKINFFDNLDDLFDYIQEQIDDTLQDEVFEEVRDVMQDNIKTHVYKAYSPEEYKRRKKRGGLIADENIKGEIESSGVLVVYNTTPFNQAYATLNKGNELIGLIEYGHGWNNYFYDYPKEGEVYMKPRKPIANTIGELRKTDALMNALEKGLKKRGVL